MSRLDTPVARRRVVKVALLLVAAMAVSAALAVAGARAAGESGASETRGAADLTGVVLYCSTDTVTLSGAYHYTENGLVNQLGNNTFFSRGKLSFDLAGVSGTGASGTSYRVTGATSLSYAFFFGGSYGGGDVEHSTETWHLVPSNGGAPLSFHETFVLVSAPNGSTILVDGGSGDCS
jgi:hypothetical protein